MDGCRYHFSSARTGSPWPWGAAVVLGLFLLSSGAVYLLGRKPAQQPAHFTATAVVLHAGFSTAGSQSAQDRTVPDGVIWEAIGGSGSGLGAADLARIAQVRRNLQVVSSHSAKPGWMRTTVTYTGPTAEESLEMANRLAQQFAEHERSAAAAPASEAHLRAKALAEQARQEMLATESEWERFVRQHFERLREQSAQRPTTAEPRKVENPQYASLSNLLSRLNERRTEMLQTRTPAHPTVQDLAAEIERAEKLLAVTPRYLADHRQPEEPVGTTEQDLAMEGYLMRSAAVDAARRKHERLAAAEGQALSPESRPPIPEVQLASRCDPAPTTASGGRWLLIPLAAVLAMTTGLGLVWLGINRDATFSSLAEVEAALPVPIVGVVTVETSSTRPSAHRPAPAA